MKKLGMLFTGLVLALVLGACSEDGLDEVVDTHNDIRDALGGDDVEESIEEIQNLLGEYSMQEISKEEFDERKEAALEAVSEMRDNLDAVDKPKGDRAVEYYELSYDMTIKSLDNIEEALDMPEDFEDEEEVLKYQERIEEGQEEEMEAMEKVEELREELEEEGVEFEEQ